MRNQKGITLIALIITIIVMLILVAVTISVALNGGILSNASKATKDTQIQVDREKITSSVSYALNYVTGIVDGEKLGNDLGNKWTVIPITENEEIVGYTCTSEKGNVFIVSSSGEISIENTNTNVNINTGWTYNSTTNKYEKGEESYSFGAILTNEQVLQKLGIETPGTYSGDWKIIGLTSSNKLKLMSMENVIDLFDVHDYAPNTEDTLYEKERWCYLNAATIFNNGAIEATGIDSARSINLEDVYDVIGEIADEDKGEEYGKEYTQTSGTYIVDGVSVEATEQNPVPIISNDIEYFLNKSQVSNLNLSQYKGFYINTYAQGVNDISSNGWYGVYQIVYWGDALLVRSEMIFSNGPGYPETTGLRAIIEIE